MWHSPLSFPPSSADVLTRNPRSKLALQQLREREERLQKEAARRTKLRRMAARGLLPTQIDSASGLSLGHAFKLQREQEETKQRAVRKARREAERARQRRRPGAAAAKTGPPRTEQANDESRGAATGASGRTRRASGRGHAKPWDAAAKRPKTAEEARAERSTAIQSITARNDKIKQALQARSAASAGARPVKRNASAPAMSYEALSATADHFPMDSDMGAAFEFSDSSSDDEADELPGLDPQPRPVTAPLQPAGHIFNYLDELATRPLSGGLVRGRPNANTRDTLKSVSAAYSHSQYDESRPSTPYLEQVLANESLYRGASSWADEDSASALHSDGDDGSGDEEDPDGADESRDAFNSTLESQPVSAEQMFRLAGCGITTAMTTGIGAQIAQCQMAAPDGVEPDEEPFRVDLRANGFGDLGALAVIEGVLANKRVTALDLAQNRLGSSSGSALQIAIQKSNITELDISENPIGNKGVAALCAGLAGSFRLETLRMDKCGFDSVGAAALTKALSEGASGLRSLSISANMVGTAVVPRQAAAHRAGAQDLIHELANHTNLQAINLSWNSFGDAGATAFLDAARERGVDGGSLGSLDLSASNLTERGANALCELMTECTQLQTLVLNGNAGIGFRGALPFLRMKQAGEIDEIIFGRGASAKPPITRGADERWRTVELRGCGCENLPLPMMAVPTGAVAGDVPSDSEGAQEKTTGTDQAHDTSTDASFAVPVLASAEQRELLACGIAGWGDGVPWTWKQELPHQLVDKHFDLLYAARKAARQAKADEAAVAAKAERTLSPEEILQQELMQKAGQEAAEARDAAALAQRESLEAAEAELTAQKEWSDVKAIEQRLKSLEGQYEELLHGDDMEALDRIQATIFKLREQLDHERWEAEEADRVAAVERAEAAEAAARAENERLEAESAAAKANAENNRADGRRGKKSAAAGLRVQASRGHPSGAMTAPTHGTRGGPSKPATTAVGNRRAAAMARMALTPTRSPTRERETRHRSSKMAGKAWQNTKSFRTAVKKQVNMQRLKQQNPLSMCKSLKLPLRPSSASGPMGQGAQAPLIGSFSADPLDARLRRGPAQEAAMRRQPLEHGLSFSHPQLITEKEARQHRTTGVAHGGQEAAAWEARQVARKARRQSEAHPRAVDTVISPQRHPSLYA
jgi:hypothetical protein